MTTVGYFIRLWFFLFGRKINSILPCKFRNDIILIFNQPTDKSSAEISPFFVKLPCRAASPPAVTFLDWSYFICRLCL